MTEQLRVLSLAKVASATAVTTNEELSSYVPKHGFLKSASLSINTLTHHYDQLNMYLLNQSVCRSRFGTTDQGLHCLQLGGHSGVGNTATSSCIRSAVAASGKNLVHQCTIALRHCLSLAGGIQPVSGGRDFNLDWVLIQAVLQP